MKKDRGIEGIELGLFGILILILHSMVGLNTQDDLYFTEIIKQYDSVLAFVGHRYNEWSSRVLIEATLVSILQWNDWVWRIIDSIMILMAAFSISEITLPKGKKKFNIITIIGISLIPVSLIHSAGYGATTINYIWPLATGLFAMIPLSNTLKQETTSPVIKILAFVFAIYATNLEQMAAILAGISAYVVLERLVKKQKPDIYAILLLILAVGMVIFALTCPGNQVRAEIESQYFTEFQKYLFLEKIELGFLSTCAYYFGIIESNLTLCVLFAGIVVAALKQKRVKEILWSIPSFGIFLYYRCFVQGIYSEEKEEKTITLFQNIYPSNYSDYEKGMVAAELVVYLVLVSMLVIGIYRLSENKRKAKMCSLILLAGFLSRMVLSLSSNIINSGYRTTLFFSVSMIMASIMLIEPSLPIKEQK